MKSKEIVNKKVKIRGYFTKNYISETPEKIGGH